ncbi:MAG: DUF302 domain-containing protein [Gammaproteobacteria bacterium]|nr:DUF302 domain-containing protein [Gammaproteobacteria bacterium]
MSAIKNILIGFIIGILLVGIIGWKMMPGMMLHEYQSPHDLKETVNRIKMSAIKEGWVIAGIKPLHKSVEKHGGHKILPVMLVNLCQADHAYNILKNDSNKILSVMMPCTISVYEKKDGKTYIGAMNAELLGKMFGGDIAQIMGVEVAEQQKIFIDTAMEK